MGALIPLHNLEMKWALFNGYFNNKKDFFLRLICTQETSVYGAA